MKYKNTLVLLLILFFLSLVSYFQLQEREQKFQTKNGELLLFPHVTVDQIDRLEIITLKRRTVLEKKNKLWLVNTSAGYPADDRLVNILLKRVRTLKAGEIVTDKPQKHSALKVDGTGIKVKLWKNRKLQVSFYVGKTDDNYVDTYLRKEGSDQVTVVHDNIQQIFTPYEWRSRYIFHFKPEDIREITVTYPEEVVHIRYNAGRDWEMTAPEKGIIDKPTAKKFLDDLAMLRILDFVKEEIIWENPDPLKFKIEILLKDETTRTLIVGNEANPTACYVRIMEKTPVFLVSSRWLDRLKQYSQHILRP